MSRDDDTYDWAGFLVQRIVREKYPSDGTKIIDVGPCWGKYRILLPEYTMDACEIWEPYVRNEGLRSKYRNVYVEDICDLVDSERWNHYDLVIMGDVFEHIPRDRAKIMLQTVLRTCGDVIIVVPYLYEQGEEHGNPHQAHLQADLTPALMESEYPDLQLIETEWRIAPFKGLYMKKPR